MKVESFIPALLVAAVLSASGSARAGSNLDPSETERAGDMLQVGVPLLALGLTFLLEGGDDNAGQAFGLQSQSRLGLDTDWLRLNDSPRHNLMLAMARTEVATYALKYGVNSERPNGGSHSFPSGHTSVAFAGAEFIRKEYGGWWGVPAYLTAGFVGWSRVASENHWPRDVYAGALIGIASNHDLLNLEIPFGQLTVAPSLMLSNSTDFGPRDSDLDETSGVSGGRLVPSLQFQLRF